MTHPTRWTPPEWPDAPEVECPNCRGTGRDGITCVDNRVVTWECPECHGTGTIPAPVEERDEDTAGDEAYHRRVDDDAERGGRK